MNKWIISTPFSQMLHLRTDIWPIRFLSLKGQICNLPGNYCYHFLLVFYLLIKTNLRGKSCDPAWQFEIKCCAFVDISTRWQGYKDKERPCYTKRRRDNFPGTQFFLDKLLILKKGLVQGIPKQLAESKKNSEFFDGSLSPSENRTLGEKALSGQMLLELNLSLPLPYVW